MEQEQPSPQPVPDMASNPQTTDSLQQDYDFVQQPDQDYYCPVTLDILLDPQQTTCCGHHISQQAANRSLRDHNHVPCVKTLLLKMTSILREKSTN